VENTLVHTKRCAIVPIMSIEKPNVVVESKVEKPPMSEMRKSAYASAVEVFREHDSVEPEMEQLLFQEKLAENGPEVAIASLEFKIAAAEEQKEIFAGKGDPFSEEAWSYRANFLKGMKDIVSIYCDVKENSPEFAKYIAESHPWVEKKLKEAEELVAKSKESEK
jgi:hypothetical protein